MFGQLYKPNTPLCDVKKQARVPKMMEKRVNGYSFDSRCVNEYQLKKGKIGENDFCARSTYKSARFIHQLFTMDTTILFGL